MKAKVMFVAVSGLFIAAGVSAQSASMPPDQAAKSEQRRAKTDKDGDGAISREEANGKKRLSAHFDAIDSNKDGKLSKEELQASRSASHPQHKAGFEQHFTQADKDGDGALTKAEAEAEAGKLKHLVQHFDQLDADKDGKIAQEEVHAGKGKSPSKAM